jgi:Flp pilus assembly pilin Flp
MTEYVILLVLIAMAALALLRSTGEEVADTYSTINSALDAVQE